MSEDEDLMVDLEDHDLETFEEDRSAEEAIEAQAEEGETAEDADKKAVKPKRVIRNPQPKFNAERLKGKRGLTALESYFDRVKFKGRGHEEQDLAVILKTYEYWCHRLFPKFQFEECISRIENRLGTKKPVLTHIKKIRLDMLFNDNDDQPIIDNHDSDDDIPNDQFDELLPQLQTSNLQPPVDISEEQLERIRLNKERAVRIRREKLRQNQEMATSSQEPCSSHTSLDHDTYLDEEVTSQIESQVELCGTGVELSSSEGITKPVGNKDLPLNSVPSPLTEDIHD